MDEASTPNNPPRAPSIRDTATNPARPSTGSQQSQDSHNSSYNVNYRHRARRERGDGQQQMPPPMNLDESRLNPRICLCDQHLFPLSCEECDVNTGTACALHMTVTCNSIECEKRFHKDCLCTGLSTYATLDELRDSHTCMECSCRADAATEDQPYDYFPLHSLNDIDSLNERLLRFGMDPLPPNAETPQRRKARTSMKNLKDALDHCNRDLNELPALVERGIDPRVLNS